MTDNQFLKNKMKMKNKILALLVLAMITISTTFANDINVNDNVLAAFSEQFLKASKVNWVKTADYYKASFEFNGQHLSAFFSEEGEMIGVKRNLLSTELPINLQVILNKKYSGYWVSELFEYAANGETTYYISVENADQNLTLQSVGSTDWLTFSRKTKQ